ncbi:hypothetical protein A3L12_00320 [Thermococcus sp. P6]|uniref:hypothetical protein n=1 Tax=Thermococcus sp. P6 TaxID=122420 RepID=UPI000B59DA14|nr:hypothetical protein [Thermococcus sp. P6]ASJ09856.1 hypothetical protein A3L12_00320 [Thermococcus sp. P6]
MKLERALEEYGKRKRRAEKEVEEIRKAYNRRLEKKVGKLLRMIDELERREVPKNVAGNIRRIVTSEKRNYVRALRNGLTGINDIEDLGKRLPNLAKLHVGHGRYLLEIFEKEVYGINRLLRELNEDYAEYLGEIAKKNLPDLRLEEIITEEKETRERISELERETLALKGELENRKKELEDFYRLQGLEELEREMEDLSSSIRSAEIDLRSRASKLQKPLRRMRLKDEIASRFVEDSGVALERPDEFVSLLQRVYPELEAKYRKRARWLMENLKEKSGEIKRKKERLHELEEKRREILSGGEERERGIWELQHLLEEKAVELRKLKNRLEHLEEELRESLSKLESILGQDIER